MKHSYALLVLLLLSGCQSTLIEYRQSSFAIPPVGSTLQLHQEFTIPAGKAAVTIQDGLVQPSSWRLNQYRPHCEFELNSVSETARHVAPQTFTIVRALRDQENVMRDQPVQFAGRGHFSGVLGKTDTGNGSPMENNMLIMYLRAQTELDVLRMTCQVWIDSAIDDDISINDVRATLGELFTLTLAGK